MVCYSLFYIAGPWEIIVKISTISSRVQLSYFADCKLFTFNIHLCISYTEITNDCLFCVVVVATTKKGARWKGLFRRQLWKTGLKKKPAKHSYPCSAPDYVRVVYEAVNGGSLFTRKDSVSPFKSWKILNLITPFLSNSNSYFLLLMSTGRKPGLNQIISDFLKYFSFRRWRPETGIMHVRERIMSMCRLESRHLKNQKEFPELCETKVRQYILHTVAKVRKYIFTSSTLQPGSGSSSRSQ